MTTSTDRARPRGGRGRLPTRGAPRQVVDQLRRVGPTTRTDLCETLGLSRASVSAALAQLRKDGLVEERDGPDPGTSVRGRPPGLVALSRRAGVVVGVDLGRSHLRVAVADLGHDVITERTERFEVDFRPEEALDEVGALVEAALADASAEPDEALGVCLGLPAPLDQHGRPTSVAIPPGWGGHRPDEELSRRLGLPVRAENDANLGALAESQWGAGRGAGDQLYIKAATGIGGGLILDGKVFRGGGGTAGEIGHTTISDTGAVCTCGNRGCLELRAGGTALVAQLAMTAEPVENLPSLVEKAREGHLGCRRVLDDAGEALGVAVASIVNVLNLDLVVLGGELGRAGELVLGRLREQVYRNAIAPAAAHTRVVAGDLGDRAEVLGAALLVLSETAHFPSD